jgi:general secretion pathway protein B
MSFILDALRKSEHEREQRLLPGIVEAPKAQRGGSSVRWIVGLLAALFVVNSAALIYLLARDRAPAPAPVLSNSAAALASGPVPATDHAAPRPATAPGPVRELIEEARAGSSTAPYADVPPTPVHAQIQSRHDTAVSPPAARPTPARSIPEAAETAGASLPTRRQLPAAVVAMLPALSVDLHVYSPEPAQRFMVISGQRAQEGATVAGGVVIEKITPDGAIAVFRGTRFLLTRE